jgi:L-2-hydroxyglutarate oxidase LhgO
MYTNVVGVKQVERYQVDTLVIGAGVIGIATARALALAGHKVWLLERESTVASVTSARNSEVIHAGIYYPKNSLKAKLCVRGKHLLYDFLRRRGIPHRRCGKLIVASSSDMAKLEGICHNAQENGVTDLSYLNRDALLALEPQLNATGALLSPSTGILDSHAFIQCLLADAEQAGVEMVLASELQAKQLRSSNFEFELTGHNALLQANKVVNAAGLDAINLLSEGAGFPQQHLPKPYFAKGSYFSYSGTIPFKHLIYPIPEEGGLGVHLTLDIAGAGKFGPDVEWLDHAPSRFTNFDYSVSSAKHFAFVEAVRKFWPSIDDSKLNADYAGLRPKLSGPGQAFADFMIQDESEHGLTGMINLFGIESPGLTASLSIAETVAKRLSMFQV